MSQALIAKFGTERQTRTNDAQVSPLVKLFVCSIGVGTAIGAWAGYTMVTGETMTLLTSALSYGAYGAAGGLLVAGLYDVIFQGSLDDRPEAQYD